MGGIITICSETRLATLTVLLMMALFGAMVQIADAPSSEALNPGKAYCYQIDDSGRIVDSDLRVRGWIKGDEIFGPDLELRYRLVGRRLEDAQ
jgi:hypothetical protein